MSIEFKSRFDPKKVMQEKIAKAKKALDIATQFEVTQIKINMNAGRSYDGTPFEQYSDSYQAFRQKKGYKVSPPNLTRTGAMRDSLHAKAPTIQGGEITGGMFISSDGSPLSTDKARWVQSDAPPRTSKNPKYKPRFANRPGRKARKFFGLSAQAIERIVKRVQEAFNK